LRISDPIRLSGGTSRSSTDVGESITPTCCCKRTGGLRAALPGPLAESLAAVATGDHAATVLRGGEMQCDDIVEGVYMAST
jgi:hypothetical protein